MYDIIIIGAGPAGISAAIYAISRGKKTVVIEKNKIGGLIGNVSTVTHYTAILENETGKSLAERMKRQALQAGVEVVCDTVKSVSLTGNIKKVTTENCVYEGKKVILANGSTPRKLGIPGEDELAGKGMGLNAARDGEAYKGKNMYVVGGADGAIKEALYLSQYAKQLTIIHFEKQLGCIAEFKNKLQTIPNIQVILESRLHAVHGDTQVETLDIASEKDGTIQKISDPGCGIFVYAGASPNTELYTELALENGYIPVNDLMETAISRVYAVGDIRVKQVRQVATAVADGAIAAVNAAK